MEFGTHYPKIRHFDILNILSQRNLRKQQKQKVLFELPLPLLLWRRSQNPHVGGTLPILRASLFLKMRGCQEEAKKIFAFYTGHSLVSFSLSSIYHCYDHQLNCLFTCNKKFFFLRLSFPSAWATNGQYL